MTSKHFIEIAKVLKAVKTKTDYHISEGEQIVPMDMISLVNALSDCFKRLNPRFDRNKFLDVVMK